MNKLEIGKLSNEELKNYVLKNITVNRDEVLFGADIGVDTAVLDFKDNLIVASTDPITGATNDIGKLAINVSCNDIACECAEPVGVLISVLLPPNATLDELDAIIKDASRECEKLNLNIVGGHTEVTDAVNRIVVTTTVLGKVKRELLPKINRIESGDVIAISKYIGIEGTCIAYNERKNELDKILSKKDKIEICSMSEMLSVVNESKIAKDYNVKFMHDITEGGLYGALWESSNVIKKAIEIDKNLVPIKNSTKKISKIFDIDVFRFISSGSMIFIFSKEDFLEFKLKCEKNNILITEIGIIKEGSDLLIKGENREVVLEATVDELYKIV
ncbi:AIR synthase family protein [Peptoniphilus sp. oral taxon 386]|uniref:AIR synthase family protein n=1 Tax=Peptoniphilus sp. oral taxon 386 TaxID=652713 RepID=UPI0020D22164|nr:AIR synthase family protein [Peptoniphilus sp. oral taxon 386]